MFLVEFINEILWGKWQVLIYLLLFAGCWFSYSLGGIQLRRFTHMFSLLKESRSSNSSGISAFQALCTSLSARVGTGNLAGVAIAISAGGPGAVFWMWAIAVLGMATGFAESLLGQVYKVRDSNQEFRGGPAYYIEQGLGLKWMAILFSISLFVGYGFIFSAVQANTIVDAMNYSYGFDTTTTGAMITLVAAIIVAGGLRAIARFAEIVVPIMGGIFILVALTITLLNISLLPDVLLTIFKAAFGLQEAAAGSFAAALKIGMQRGLYSNEAGAGSVPQAAAAAAPTPNHPATQGYIQMLGVFIDTLVLCTCTAFIILLAGGATSGEVEGIRLTQAAMEYHIGPAGEHFVVAAITLFAFTSIVGNYAYAEANLHFFKLDNSLGRLIYTLIFLLMMFLGSRVALTQVWATADMALGVMTVINIVAIIMLTPTIKSVGQHYEVKLKTSGDQQYKAGDCFIQGKSERNVW